ncbi:ABC transporter permease [Actinoplanes sp. RD1]|uniref:ABC transporter permease n=1 Tax=Actinoplanes sp. RD1 TaxID=3064538 RepID=UPI0027418C80|nr:ABC transporter permease subunit [Actinoplanes sp. RD1]
MAEQEVIMPLPAARRRLRRPSLEFLHPRMWLPLVLMLVLLGFLWQWGAHKLPYLLPPLEDIGTTLHEDADYYLDSAWATLKEALGGLGLGLVCAFVLAIVVSEFPLARRAIMPVAVILNVTPLVAIAPALVVAFGFGMLPKLIVTGLICFFPILINTSMGLRTVPQPVLQVYRTVNASRLETLWYIRIPSAMPYLFAALRIVFPLSIVGAVVAELSAAGSSKGLGTAISLASSMNRLAAVWASIAILAVLGSLLLLVVTLLERRVLHWHETRQGSGR